MKGYLELTDKQQWDAFWDTIWEKYKGKQVQWEVKKVNDKRTLQQNKYYWSVVVNMVAEYCGYHPDEAHEILLQEFAPLQEVGTDRWHQKTIVVRSSQMTVDEMIYYIDRIVQEMASIGLEIPSPDNLDYAS